MIKDIEMKNSILAFGMALLLMFVWGCSDDDNPVTPNLPENTVTSTWDEEFGYWETLVNGSDYDNYTYFSFGTQDTVTTATPKVLVDGWDIAFRREVVMLNGGSSAANGGDAVGADLGVVDFAGITIDDTVGVIWVEDAIDYFMDDWYIYNTQTHVMSITENVYSMLDAGGENYLKFRVDSLVGGGQPPNMGTVHITYYYQSTASSRDLSGATSQAAITVGMETGYFDFSSGSQVTPMDPASDLGWDIGFSAYDLFQNSGPRGSGNCAAFQAFSELTDPTDIDEFTAQPMGAPLFPDIPSSALTEWYDYDPQKHQLTSKGNVYLIESGGSVYKVRLESYYSSATGTPVSGYYTFVWIEL